jgi:predicted kinase
MARLIITRGLPGAGKTTRARVWVAQDPASRARVNRDDMRAMLHERWLDEQWLDTDEQEAQISAAAHAAVEALLRRGVDVVCDDTNLFDEHVQVLRHVAERSDADIEIWDMTDVPVEVCIARDYERGLDGGHYIGDKAIWRMNDEYRRRIGSRAV